jgi:hypothetical protein
MVYTAVPPDYCDNDVKVILQQAPSAVNFHVSKDQFDNAEEKLDLLFQGIDIYSSYND